MATCPCLRQQRSFCRRAIHPCDNDKAAGGPFNTATTGFRRRNYSSLRQRKVESDASPLRQKLLQAGHSSLRQRKFESDTASMRLRLLQAGHSTCRHDGTAVILDFRPKLANRCSQEAKTRAIRASIPDFKPRLANRCSKEVKTRAIRASILDFKPRLANRCSAEVKTGIIPAAQGRSIMPRQGNAGWAGTSDGVAARGFVNGEGPTAQRWEGKHRRCAPVRSPCPQADSDAETPSTRHKKKSPDSSLNRDSRSAAATYSPTWCSSTIGASELNFSVRDGKRWILTAITAAI